MAVSGRKIAGLPIARQTAPLLCPMSQNSDYAWTSSPQDRVYIVAVSSAAVFAARLLTSGGWLRWLCKWGFVCSCGDCLWEVTGHAKRALTGSHVNFR